MDATTETLLIYRRPYWFIPDNSRWEAMLAFLFFTRFSEFLNRKPGRGRARGLWDLFLYPLVNPLSSTSQLDIIALFFFFFFSHAIKLLGSILDSLYELQRWAISKFLETTLLHALPLQKNGLIPNESFVDQMASCLIAKPPPLLFKRVEEGHIRLCKSPNWSFDEKGLILDAQDGCNSQRQHVEVDVVILATGYDSQSKLLSLIPEDYRDQLFDSKGVLPLYRYAYSTSFYTLIALTYIAWQNMYIYPIFLSVSITMQRHHSLQYTQHGHPWLPAQLCKHPLF